MAVSTADNLIKKGVSIAVPGSLELGDNIDPDRISGEDVTIHAGCKFFGSKTLICSGAELGHETPVTIKNCYIGPNVKLKGGYFENAIFL